MSRSKAGMNTVLLWMPTWPKTTPLCTTWNANSTPTKTYLPQVLAYAPDDEEPGMKFNTTRPES